jgi:hypothetical protein
MISIGSYPRGCNDISIPSTVRHLHVVDTVFFLPSLSEDMAVLFRISDHVSSALENDHSPIFRGSDKARHGVWGLTNDCCDSSTAVQVTIRRYFWKHLPLTEVFDILEILHKPQPSP